MVMVAPLKAARNIHYLPHLKMPITIRKLAVLKPTTDLKTANPAII